MPIRRLTIRRLAALFALAAAAIQLLLLVAIEQQVRSALGVLGPDPTISGFRWVWVVLAPLPWLVGAVLLLVGRPRLGTAVLVAAAALGLAAELPALTGLVAGGAGSGTSLAARLAVVGQPVVLLLGVLAAATAWWSCPRDRWRVAAPGPIGVYVAFAVLAWLPTALQTLELSPPGAMRSFARTELSRLEGIEATSSVSGAVVAAVLLFVAPRLRPDVAGAVLLVFAVPRFAAAVGDAAQVQVTEHLILTPPAVLGSLGLVGVIVLAIWWLTVARRWLAAAAGAGTVQDAGGPATGGHPGDR